VTRIVYLFTTEYDAALTELERQAPVGVKVEKMCARAEDRTAFYNHLAQIWRDGEDVLVVEQSVVIACGTVDALEACEEPWCSCNGHTWPCREDTPPWTHAFLQCNRWRGAFMQKFSQAFDEVDAVNRHWATLDRIVLPKLQAVPHVHADRRTGHDSRKLCDRHRQACRLALATVWACRTHGSETYLAAPAPDRDDGDRGLAVRQLVAGPASVCALAQRIDAEWCAVKGGESAAPGYSRADLDRADFDRADEIATALDLKHLAELSAGASCWQPVR
jgi:hypothetical protein